MKLIFFFTVGIACVIRGVLGTTQIQTAVEGVSTNININCDLGRESEAPVWFINNVAYELLNIPIDFPFIPMVEGYSRLTIPVVSLNLSNTHFQCASFNTEELVKGNPSIIKVIPSSSPLGELPQVNSLVINYQELDIGVNNTRIEWNFDDKFTCSTKFVLQGFNLSSVQSENLPAPFISYTVENASTIEIPTDHLMNLSGDPIVFRLVAVNENGRICSQSIAKERYYRFDLVSQKQEMRVISANSTTCFDIPVTDICTSSLSFVWPRDDSGSACACPIHNSTDGHMVFESCSCLNRTNTKVQVGENGSICLTDRNFNLNGTTVLFQCNTDPCTGDCLIITVISLYRIMIISDPDNEDITTCTCSVTAEIPGNLHFKLNNQVYSSGSSILITNVGASSAATSPSFPDSSLVCVTSEVNSNCCRKIDGGNVGEWYFPDGTLVPQNEDNSTGNFSRTAYTHQVRLNRRNGALSPAGVYTCVVPREDGCRKQVQSATIALVLPTPRSVLTLCYITLWNPPSPGTFDDYSGYNIRFFTKDNAMIFRKQNSQFFHFSSDEIFAMGPQDQIYVQVRVLSHNEDTGPWTEPTQLCSDNSESNRFFKLNVVSD